MVDLSKARKSIEKLYTDTCNIYESKKQTDPITHKTYFIDKLIAENEPCQLSYKNQKPVLMSIDDYANLYQETELFIRPELDIKAGSKVVVNRFDEKQYYKISGVSARFKTHQQIILEIYERHS